MKSIRITNLVIPLVAIITGVSSALLAYNCHNVFFVLIPLWSFVLGYFTNWRVGLLSGFLLFVSYTTIISFIHNPLSSSIDLRFTLPYDYLANFLFGGFSLVLIGGFAPYIRKQGLKHWKSILVFGLMAIVIVYSIISSLPRYQLTYDGRVRLLETGEISEAYLPFPVAPYKNLELYENIVTPQGYTYESVDTVYGRMLKLRLTDPGLIQSSIHIEFKQKVGTDVRVHIGPELESEHSVKNDGNSSVAVPYKLNSVTSESVVVHLRVSAAIIRESNINYYNFKSVLVSDTLEFQGDVPADTWQYGSVETSISEPNVTGASGY